MNEMHVIINTQIQSEMAHKAVFMSTFNNNYISPRNLLLKYTNLNNKNLFTSIYSIMHWIMNMTG